MLPLVDKKKTKTKGIMNLVSGVGFAIVVGKAKYFAVLAIRATLGMISGLNIMNFIGAINGCTADVLALLFSL